jgi:hypothetical protein
MAVNTPLALKNASLKKQMMTEVSQQLSTALTRLKEALGAKKFDKRVRKAAKLLTSGIKDPQPAKPTIKKASAKKTAPKKVLKTPAKKVTKSLKKS